MNKTILKYGLISGAIASALMLISALYYHQTSNFKNGEVFGYAGILLSMLFVYFGTRAYRDRQEGGKMSFLKAFEVSLLITLISCLCYVVTWMFVYEFIMPDFMDKFADHMVEQMKVSGAGEEQIRQEMAKMEEYKAMYRSPLKRFALTFIEPFPVGLLVSIVSSIVLRRK